MKPKLTVFILLFFISIAVAREGSGDINVTHLSASNITEITYNLPFVVLFFAPWCPHCQAFRPTYEKFADSVAGKVGVGDVDCTVELYLQDLFGIQGYPTVFYFIEGMMYEYTGDRRVAALEDWINSGYLDSDATPLPEVSSVAAANYSSFRKFTQTVYTILVVAVILGVAGFLSYFCCFNDLRTQSKSFLALRVPKNRKYEPIKENSKTAIPSYYEDELFLAH